MVVEEEIMPDTIGAGTYDSAPSCKFAMTPRKTSITCAYSGDGIDNPPKGACGGQHGHRAAAWKYKMSKGEEHRVNLSPFSTEDFKRNQINEDRQTLELYMEAHYPFQVWELAINITEYLNDNFEIIPESISKIEEAFHTERERTFSVKDDTYLQCIYWRVKAIGTRERSVVIPEQDYKEDNIIQAADKRTGSRKIYFKAFNKRIVTPIFNGSNLVYGDVIQGPAIIEEPMSHAHSLRSNC